MARYASLLVMALLALALAGAMLGPRLGGLQGTLTPTPPLEAAGQPLLQIVNSTATIDGYVTVPVSLEPNGAQVSAVLFSIDFDQNCLLFDPADTDGNRIPDAINFQTPPAFSRSVSYDADDTDGELDIVFADYSPPYAIFTSQVLVTVRFAIVCQPLPQQTIESPVLFSQAPSPSFSSGLGTNVRGTALGGIVTIPGEGVFPTPLPTATSTPTPTLIPTATPTATLTSPGTMPTQPSSPLITPTPFPSRDHDVDGVLTVEEGTGDWDGDGIPNYMDPGRRRRRHPDAAGGDRRCGRRRGAQLPGRRLQRQRHP